MKDTSGNEKPGVEKLNPENKTHAPGEGIRSLRTSMAFRALNFELYARPNKVTMAVGLLGITVCFGYLIYMNFSHDRSKFYIATQEDGTPVLQPRKSRWDT